MRIIITNKMLIILEMLAQYYLNMTIPQFDEPVIVITK
jgi:hypothetical protein